MFIRHNSWVIFGISLSIFRWVPFRLQVTYHWHLKCLRLLHDDVIKWKHFPRSPVNSPSSKGQWRGDLMFSLICAWISGWVNNREAGDLRRQRTHYDVIVMLDGVMTWKRSTYYRNLVDKIQQRPADYHHEGQIQRRFNVFVIGSLNELLNKQLSSIYAHVTSLSCLLSETVYGVQCVVCAGTVFSLS